MLFLTTHWLAILLLILAATLSLRCFLRRKTTLVEAGTIGVSTLLAVGALTLTNWPVSLFNYQFTFAEALLGVAFVGFALTLALLIVSRLWSFGLGVFLGAVTSLGIGAALLPDLSNWLVVAFKNILGLEFVQPEWLFLLLFVPMIYFISRKSLSGLGPTRKWVAISARMLGIALLAFALAEPRFRRESENVTVIYIVDRSFSIPQDLDPSRPISDTADRRWDRIRTWIEDSVRERGPDHRDDQVGVILFGKRPKVLNAAASVDMLPIREQFAGPIDGNYTNIAASIKLALASFPEGTGKRIVLISDGNENIGSAEQQAVLAKENDVQIDTIALAPGFRNESEVLIQAVEAPPVTAEGQRLPVRVLIRNATPNTIVEGRLQVSKSFRGIDRTISIVDSPQLVEDGDPPKVRLLPGLNVFRFQDKVDNITEDDRSFVYRATFTPTNSRSAEGGAIVAGLPGDRATNNKASAAVVARGIRQVLFVDQHGFDGQPEHQYLIQLLLDEKISVIPLPVDKLPTNKSDLGVLLSNYDALILGNVPAEKFTRDQMEIIRSSVFDQGCGLVMIGGPDSFGPGGYQETPIEEALPVDCEIKALKAAGKGGLVLIMHASEMADGNKWQKDIAKLAIQRLGPADMVGLVYYGAFGGVVWHIPFQSVGENRDRLLARVDAMAPGDMPDYNPYLRAAADTLSNPDYNLSVKHCILISDGDGNYSGPGQQAVADMAANNITCTTVGVATHGVAENNRLKNIAEGTRDGKGKTGTFYPVTNPNQLPGIYIKESRRVSQSFIFDKRFDPKLRISGGPAEGLTPDLPDLFGFVRTTLKVNPLVEMEIEGPSPYPDQKFPVLASWRYGLGKAVAYTSDARTQPNSGETFWDRLWVQADLYKSFWKQVVTWVMREAERGRLTIMTEYRDGIVRVTADVRDDLDRPVIGMSLRGAVTTPGELQPGEEAPSIEFKPKGGGQYEAEFPAEEAGSYFLNVQALDPERDAAGNVIIDPKTGLPVMEVYDGARAGVTVPYSPEFADLESNTPMMKRLADLTGGTFHEEGTPELREWLDSGSVFRKAPSTTRALLPFWFWLVFAAAVLLLIDVATRRISLEWLEVRTASTRFWRSLRQPSEVAEESAGLGQLLRRKASVEELQQRQRATRRFDPDAVPTAEPAPEGADDYAARIESSAPPPSATPIREPEPVEEEDTFTKLKKARDRARKDRER